MKIKKPIPPPQNWWAGSKIKCKCLCEIEFEDSDKLKTEAGAYGWYVNYKCPACNHRGTLFFDLENGKRGIIKMETAMAG